MPNATTWIWSLLSTLAVSSVSLIGLVAVSIGEERTRRLSTPLVALGVGTLLGDAFIHLIPEALESSGGSALEPSLLLLSGVLVFFAVDKLVRRRSDARGLGATQPRAELVVLNAGGDAVHNFIDGVLIAAAYLVSPSLGISTSLAVICHEVPQELADFAILVHAGMNTRRAIALNLASASAAVLGTVCALAIGATAGPALVRVLIPVTAGGFVYIAAANLMPELQRDRSSGALLTQLSIIALGIAVMALLTLLE